VKGEWDIIGLVKEGWRCGTPGRAEGGQDGGCLRRSCKRCEAEKEL
jgi:hypothetical protein